MKYNKPIYLPGLNGIRAIASIAVVISHITLSLNEFNLDPYLFGAFIDGKPRGLLLAGYGVSIFFVLSGFLITYLLQLEKEYQTIDIKKFYVRRILRIWPLYYFYLSISVIVILIFGLDLSYKSLFLYVFYAANFHFLVGTTLPILVHYWSLCVEEQFYLFWPWINKKTNSLIIPIMCLIFILFGVKIWLHLFFPNSVMETIINATRFHCMMIGALGAVLYKKENKLFLKIADNKTIQFTCWIIVFMVAINKYHIASFVDNEIISVVALFLIIGQIRVKNRVLNLETPILNFLGKISYGVYVVHPLLIFLFSKILNHLTIYTPIKYIAVYLIITSSTIIMSYLSYTYFESYFLRFKKKFVVVESSPIIIAN